MFDWVWKDFPCFHSSHSTVPLLSLILLKKRDEQGNVYESVPILYCNVIVVPSSPNTPLYLAVFDARSFRNFENLKNDCIISHHMMSFRLLKSTVLARRTAECKLNSMYMTITIHPRDSKEGSWCHRMKVHAASLN